MPLLVHTGDAKRTAAQIVIDRYERETVGSIKVHRIIECIRTYLDQYGAAKHLRPKSSTWLRPPGSSRVR